MKNGEKKYNRSASLSQLNQIEKSWIGRRDNRTFYNLSASLHYNPPFGFLFGFTRVDSLWLHPQSEGQADSSYLLSFVTSCLLQCPEDRWMDGRTDGRTAGWTDGSQSFRWTLTTFCELFPKGHMFPFFHPPLFPQFWLHESGTSVANYFSHSTNNPFNFFLP